jgi:hypothetical protein
MKNPFEIIEKGDGILVVDVQKDFCPGGALAVSSGDRVVPVLNTWIEAAFLKDIPVYLSRDWHPQNHLSFKPYGGQWPPHCIQDTDGARVCFGSGVTDCILKWGLSCIYPSFDACEFKHEIHPERGEKRRCG